MKQHATQAAQQWHPTKYLKFENLRLRPALELLARVPSLQSLAQSGGDEPAIVDLGAGSCNMGPAFLYVFLLHLLHGRLLATCSLTVLALCHLQ